MSAHRNEILSAQGRPSTTLLQRIRRRSRRDEGGYVLAFASIILVPLLAVAGMATDIGGWYAEGAKMQKAADAAALAGVVWLPDLAKATAVAQDTAKANGFDVSSPAIDIVVGQLNSSEIRVTITDTAAPVYFSKFYLNQMTITRESVATYVLPVPLGSPHNYFGTGSLVSSPNTEGIWAAINSYCASKEAGDPFAARFQGSIVRSGTSCSGSELNDQYHPAPHYQYVVDVPAGRSTYIDLMLYSPAQTTSSPDSGDAAMTTVFDIKAPDGTPFDDSDNPLVACGTDPNPRSYGPSTTDNDMTIFGVSGWSRFCRIASTAPAGRYIMSVSSTVASDGQGYNSYAIMATLGGTGTPCDARTDPSCPKVAGKDWISMFAKDDSSSANFFLAEVGSLHAGKEMEISLFDVGEGGQSVQILDPNGVPATFTYRTYPARDSGGPQTSLDVSGTGEAVGPGRGANFKYNERYVILTIQLPGDYATRYPTNKWWKVSYTFASPVTVYDRTTWSVRILGDPVHLSR